MYESSGYNKISLYDVLHCIVEPDILQHVNN